MPVQKVQPSILRKVNECRVLNAIRINKSMSRADLQRELQLTMPTISKIVDFFIEQDWIEESGLGEFIMGRPPVMLQINKRAPIAIGIEVARREIRIVFVNLLGEIIHQDLFLLQAMTYPIQLVTYLKQILECKKLVEKDLIGIGFAAPGIMQDATESSNQLSFEQLSEWVNTDIQELFEREFNVMVRMENDANAAVLGELWFGKSNENQHMVFVYSDVGLGAGIAVNGSLYRGMNKMAGEFGHTIVDPNSDVQCVCGRYGCVGTLSDMMHIRHRIQTIRDEKTISHEDILHRASHGIDPEMSILKTAIRYLAVGIINLVQTIDPAVIILGGEFLTHAYVLNGLKSQLKKMMIRKKTEVITAGFERFSVAVGAATLILQDVFDHTQLIEQPQ